MKECDNNRRPLESLGETTIDASDEADQRHRTREASKLFEISMDLMCVANPEGRFLEVNPAFERTLGYSREALTSREIIEFVLPDDRDATLQTLGRLAEGDEVIGFTNRYVCKDGSIVWLEWHARTYPEDDLIYASARNITDLKRAKLEREQLELRFQRAQKHESVAVLAGGIAHDFNNLLTTILGNTGLILMGLEDQPHLRDRAKAVRKAATTAADLCEKLLAYAGEGQFDIAPRDLTTIIRETRELLEASVPKTCRLEFDLADELTAAEVDVTQVRQILMNTVKNASEAYESGTGVVHVATGSDNLDETKLARMLIMDGLEPGEYVWMEVRDRGCGMSPSKLQRIFDPFYSTKIAGRGLGLAAALGIVRAHGGTLQVRSQPGEGTRFRFYFPAVDTHQPFTPHAPLDPIPEFDGETILIVDAAEEIRSFVCQALEQQGLGVLTAESATEATEVYQFYHDELAAVLVDAELPQTDASELLHTLRAFDESVPLLLTTSASTKELAASLDPLSVGHYLQKPFGPAELFKSLGEALGRT